MTRELAYILVGDHLGQVKKVLYPTGKISLLSGCSTADSSNPVVSIESLGNKQLIAKKQGHVYIYDCIQDVTIECQQVEKDLLKALPITADKILYLYEKRVDLNNHELVKPTKNDLKRGTVFNSKLNTSNELLAIVGRDLPLKVYDVNTKTRIFDAEPPEKDWLGIQPDVFVSGVDFVGQHPQRIATCSKSDSVIRVFDTQVKPSKPVISIDINQTAFNEHADTNRFLSVASSNENCRSIVVGSNVGQLLAIDLRFNVKKVPRKKLQPRQYKILGGFKGSRGASIKEIKIIESYENNPSYDVDGDQDDNTSGNPKTSSYKVLSCSLDRYLRIHNFSKSSRNLDKHVYMTTKPICCSPVFYNNV